jgi:hypothetical protein
MRAVLVAISMAATVLTGWAYEVRPPSHGTGPYPGAWATWLTPLATISAAAVAFLGVDLVIRRGRRNLVGAVLGVVLFLIDAWLMGYWFTPAADIRFTDGGFASIRYSVGDGLLDSILTNGSHLTVRFCYGRGGVCDPTVHTSSLLDSPGTTLGPGEYVRLHYPNRTADYSITAILDVPSMTGSETVLHVEYHDRSKDPPG